MNISSVSASSNPNYSVSVKKHPHEFIDTISETVKNPHDVNDCIAIPRGIFKAYMFIMGGFAVLSIGLALPEKWKAAKIACSVIGNCLNFTSALFFAKPFFVKGLSPTVKREDVEKKYA